MKTILIDDEPDAITAMRLLLAEFIDDVEVIGTANSIIEGIKEIQNKKPDLVFLDISMPNGQGFDVLDCLPDRHFQVIFVSAFDNYAIKAIKANALDYLLKPVDIDELKNAIAKATLRQRNNLPAPNTGLLAQREHRIPIHLNDGIIYLPVKNIVHLKAEGSYTHIYIMDKKPVMVSKNLKEFENILSGLGFCRVHNSHIINITHVYKFARTDGGHVIMTDNTRIEVSRNRRELFLKELESTVV
jgi:two-component system LytT family response regulator